MSRLTAIGSPTSAILPRCFGLVLLVALGFAFSVPAGHAQGLPDRGATLSSGAQHQSIDDAGDGSGGYLNSMMGHRRATMLNNERHNAIVSDSDKLVKLAAELNDEIAHSNAGSFTPDQLRKIAEIEKLARGIRDKMTMTVGSPPSNYYAPYGPPFGHP